MPLHLYGKKIISLVAKKEDLPENFIRRGIASGEIVVTFNTCRPKVKNFTPLAIGRGLKTKVNANIGTSPYSVSVETELEKLQAAISAGADAVMDLSTGGNLDKIRRAIIGASAVSVGTVPIYQAVCDITRRGRELKDLTAGFIFETIEKQAADGVDFMTVHCGVTRRSASRRLISRRVTGIVSRGGSFIARWMEATGKENPLFENYGRLLEILKKYNVTLSLGDGLRPGSLADALDAAQMSELKILGELVVEARKSGVSVMVEGPGHLPLDKISAHIKQAKKIIHQAPYYVLGPLVTDIAAGYDHITGAIGGAIAAWAGADFLCYVTPSEHLGLPDSEDVKEGVIASKIAAHAADIARGLKGARLSDDRMSAVRKALDWNFQKKFALDPDKISLTIEELKDLKSGGRGSKIACTMCGDYCAMK